MKQFTVKELATAGLIASLYTVLSLVFMPISFGVYQIRIAEALTVLPFLTRAAVPGLYIGCLLANIIGGMGWLDIVFGPLITLAAAFATRGLATIPRRSPRRSKPRIAMPLTMLLAPLPPILFNAFGVSAYLAPLIGVSYWFSVQMVGIGQLVACYLIGLPVLIVLQRRKGVF